MLLNRPKEALRPIAKSAFAGLLVAAALFVGINEGNQNWQSMWTCAIYLLLALSAVAGAGRANPKMSRPNRNTNKARDIVSTIPDPAAIGPPVNSAIRAPT